MIEIKGRTPFSESNKYLRQVRDRSTTRGLTVALATPSTGQDFRNAHSMQRAYKEKERAGLAKGRADGEPWELYLVPRGKLADRLLDEFAGAGAREKMPAKDGTMLWVMVHPKGAAGARARGARASRARPPSREPRRSRRTRPRPRRRSPRGVFRRGAGGMIAARAGGGSDGTNRSSASPGYDGGPPPPPRRGAPSSSRSSAPHRVRHRHPRRRSRCLPRPRRRRAPAPPRARRAACPARPPPALPRHPGARGPAPEHDRAVVSQRAAGPPPAGVWFGRTGSSGPARESAHDRGRGRVHAHGGVGASVATSRRLTVETGRRMTRGVPVPVPVLPGLVPNLFARATVGDATDGSPWTTGSRSVGGWPDRDRDPDRLGGRPGPDRGGRRDDRAPQGPYDRERERDGGRGGGWNTAGRDPCGWPDRERHRDRGY